MARPPSTQVVTRNALLLLLACAAGYVDAVSYMELERVFTANMTGNTVLLGLALGRVESEAAIRSGLALAGFLVGVAVGAWVVERGRRDGVWPTAVTVALVLEWVVLFAFLIGWEFTGGQTPGQPAVLGLVALAALAMGIQSAAVRRLEVSGIVTTYITGTLTSLVMRLVRWGRHGWVRHAGARAPALAREIATGPEQATLPAHGAGLLASVWIVYAGGAVIAAVAVTSLGPGLASVLPVIMIAIVITVAAARFREGGGDRHDAGRIP